MVTLLLAAVLVQQPAQARPVEVPVLKADIGPCSADFTVKDASGEPVYGATIHVRVRYGLFGVKRSDLEVGTNSDGLARIEGLPDKARPLTFTIEKDKRKAAAEQRVETACHARHDITLE